MVLALVEMVVTGVSTPKIENITYGLCGETFSKSTIFELFKGLDLAMSLGITNLGIPGLKWIISELHFNML